MIATLISLAVLGQTKISMVPMEIVGEGRAVPVTIDGAKHLAKIDPMRLTSVFGEHLGLVDKNIRVGFGSYSRPIKVLAGSVEPINVKSSSGNKLDLVIGHGFFDSTIVCVDFINEEFGTARPSQIADVRSWLTQSELGSEIISVKLDKKKEGLWGTFRLGVGGNPIDVLLGFADARCHLDLPREAARLHILTNETFKSDVGESVIINRDIWTDAVFFGQAIPYLAGMTVVQDNLKNEWQNALPLRLVGPRRMAFDPTTGELLFCPGGSTGSFEAALRGLVLTLPIEVRHDGVYVGSLGFRREEFDGAKISSIGTVMDYEILSCARGNPEGYKKLLLQLVDERKKGKVIVKAIKDGQRRTITIGQWATN